MSNRNIKKFMESNYEIIQYLSSLTDDNKITLTATDKDNLNKIRDHIININVIFGQIK